MKDITDYNAVVQCFRNYRFGHQSELNKILDLMKKYIDETGGLKTACDTNGTLTMYINDYEVFLTSPNYIHVAVPFKYDCKEVNILGSIKSIIIEGLAAAKIVFLYTRNAIQDQLFKVSLESLKMLASMPGNVKGSDVAGNCCLLKAIQDIDYRQSIIEIAFSGKGNIFWEDDRQKIFLEKNIEIFKAAYFGNLASLQELIVSQFDLEILVLSKLESYGFTIKVVDILNWWAWGIYEFNCWPNLIDKQTPVNLTTHYKNIITCLDWLCQKFQLSNIKLKDYSHFRGLRHCLDKEDNWLDEDEMNEALNLGYRQIDLDLINACEKGNAIEVYTLLRAGANYKIDPWDDSESLIAEILETDCSLQLFDCIYYLKDKDSFSADNMSDMLSSLYQVGVGNYIWNILKMNEENIIPD